jgi:hypothetical protein
VLIVPIDQSINDRLPHLRHQQRLMGLFEQCC